MCDKTELEVKPTTRIRISYKVSAKGIFQPDITSEAGDNETAIENLKTALIDVEKIAEGRGELLPKE